MTSQCIKNNSIKCKRKNVLTRDFLRRADCRTSFGCIDESILLTPAQREASLCATLAKRADNTPVWIFGYGSLMWNPVFEPEEIQPAMLKGYHRAFCLKLTTGRGTPNQPGRMLALKEGGFTSGLAFRLPESTLYDELALLWKREMLTDCYQPTWCELQLDDGRRVTALVFIMNAAHPLFESDTREQVIAPLIAKASGPLGSNAQYLFSLDKELRHHGMHDDYISKLVAQVNRLLEDGFDFDDPLLS
jgi:cation transport protein ChaC